MRSFSPLLFAALAVACAGRTPPPEQPLPPEMQPRTEVTPPEQRRNRELPEHVAPPPAYGNKVVMAAGTSPTSTH